MGRKINVLVYSTTILVLFGFPESISSKGLPNEELQRAGLVKNEDKNLMECSCIWDDPQCCDFCEGVTGWTRPDQTCPTCPTESTPTECPIFTCPDFECPTSTEPTTTFCPEVTCPECETFTTSMECTCPTCATETPPPECPPEPTCPPLLPSTTPEPCYEVSCPVCTDPPPTPFPPTTTRTTARPVPQSDPKFTKTFYQSSVSSWPIAGTTLSLGISASTPDNATLHYTLISNVDFLVLTPTTNDILFTKNVDDGAYVGPNNVLLAEIAAAITGHEERTGSATVALIFPRPRAPQKK